MSINIMVCLYCNPFEIKHYNCLKSQLVYPGLYTQIHTISLYHKMNFVVFKFLFRTSIDLYKDLYNNPYSRCYLGFSSRYWCCIQSIRLKIKSTFHLLVNSSNFMQCNQCDYFVYVIKLQLCITINTYEATKIFFTKFTFSKYFFSFSIH